MSIIETLDEKASKVVNFIDNKLFNNIDPWASFESEADAFLKKEKQKQALKNQEKAIENYLEVETLLRKFFDEVNFCKDNCKSNIGKKDHLVGCCDGNYHKNSSNVNPLLIEKRIEKYGLPEKKEDSCGYHTSEGCKLKTHKSPICISFICVSYGKYLKDKFGIEYYKLKRNISVTDILAGETSEQELNDVKSNIKDYIEKVKNGKK